MALPTPTAPAAVIGYIVPGTRRWVWMSTAANPSSPTSAEISAGTELTSWITPDGVSGFNTETNMVDFGNLSTTYTPQIGGMVTTPASSMKFNASKNSTDVRQLLTRNLAGFLCEFPEGIPASGGKLTVWPVTVTSASLDQTSGDAPATITVDFAVTAVPTENIAIPTA